ncbi:MAG TPA: benzoyl-CoA 2,3-epoxidase subunit BoxA [Roseiarcus sp.]|nr:benzoyl-CoA 2,3-epoxidase subunit BoxA [Roseiarcus sp.]
MGEFVKQHLIDPEICIRCGACEAACPIGAIEHDERNVVVKADACNFCMSCIPVCPTGSIDNWRIVATPYTLADQYDWDELPAQAAAAQEDAVEATDATVAALLAEAHAGAEGASRPPVTAARPTVNLYTPGKPIEATVQGNYRLTAESSGADVRHIILNFEGPFPVLEGQTLGVLAPGEDGRLHAPRLYSVSSPRDGERPGFCNVSITVKREPGGICSNYVCDLGKGDKVKIAGPFGATFLMPDDPQARLLMICTGTGAAPFRAFTMRRQRVGPRGGDMTLFFGARAPDSLPYFGPLNKIANRVLRKHLVYSRIPGAPKEYVQDRLRVESEEIAELLGDSRTHVYICGLRGMEAGVEQAFVNIAESVGVSWSAMRDAMREDGRYHIETY